MPRFSQHCCACAWAGDIVAAPFVNLPCPTCGGATERLWVGTSTGVQDDSYIGGKTFENLGPDPVTLYSRSELRRELKARGLMEQVRHVPAKGSDKSPYTTSWSSVGPHQMEQARQMLERVGSEPVRSEPSGVTEALKWQVNDVLQQLGDDSCD